jgi:hypothetical protein
MARTNPRSATGPTTHQPPNPLSMLFHMVRTFSLAGSLLADPRIHPSRKSLFVGILGVLVAAVLGVEGVTEVVTNLLPVVGQFIGLGELPADAALDWVLVVVAAFNLLRLFPKEIVGEHYDRLFRSRH